MTIKDALTEAINLLKKSNIENPIQQAKILFASVLQKNKEYILINENEVLLNEIYNEFIAKIEKLQKGIPLQYITHIQEFMGMDFYVDENVLIPQPDTEILVEEVLNLIGKQENLSLLDMCTGSGAIAVSIAKYIENVEVYGVDISEKALKIAKRNAEKNKVKKKCKFIESNMFNNVYGEFDIIISNPPYIEKSKIKNLEEKVKKEPIMALDGGEDGLEFYRKLSEEAYKFLKCNGFLLLEIGYNQKMNVIHLLEEKDKYYNIYSKKDLAQNDRIVVATKR